MLKTVLLMKAEKFINSVLKLDPSALSQLKKLQGKSVSIVITDYRLNFLLNIRDEKIYIQTEKLTQVDAEFAASSWTFINVLRNRQMPYWELSKKIHTQGDMQLIQDLQALLQNLHIDWEEYLSFVIGDVATQKISGFTKKMKNWFYRNKTRTEMNVVEYLHYEKNWLPSRQEANQFFNDIRQLSYDVDRLEASLSFFSQKKAMDE